MAGFGTAFSTGIWKAHSISQQNASLSKVEEWPSLDGAPLPPPARTLERESSNLSEHGRELLNTALGFHEWQDLMQNTPPILARSFSGGMQSQAPSGTSKLSRGTSEFTVDSTIHLKQRMNERVITKRELQAARKYGVKEYEESGALKITHNSTTLILDPKTHKGITAYPTKEEEATVWAAVKTKMKDDVEKKQVYQQTTNRNMNNMKNASVEKKSNQIDSFTLQRFQDMGFEDSLSTKAYIEARGNFREAVESLLLKVGTEPSNVPQQPSVCLLPRPKQPVNMKAAANPLTTPKLSSNGGSILDSSPPSMAVSRTKSKGHHKSGPKLKGGGEIKPMGRLNTQRNKQPKPKHRNK